MRRQPAQSWQNRFCLAKTSSKKKKYQRKTFVFKVDTCFLSDTVRGKTSQGGKIRLNAAGIIALVCTDKGIAEIPGVVCKEIVADETHCPEILDRKDRRGSGVAHPEGVNLPNDGLHQW